MRNVLIGLALFALVASFALDAVARLAGGRSRSSPTWSSSP